MGAILESAGGISEANADARYVNVTGSESMAGPLTITGDLYADEVIPTTTHPVLWWRQYGAATSLAAVGGGAASVSGTATAIASTTGYLINYASTATTNQRAGIDIASAGVLAEYLPDIRITIQDVAEATFRLFVGLAPVVPLNADSYTGYFAGFRVHTSAGEGATWWIWHNNNDAGGGTKVNTNVALTANVVSLRMQWTTSTAIQFYIDGALVHTANANTPVPATAVMYPVINKITLENVAKNLRFRSCRVDLMGVNF